MKWNWNGLNVFQRVFRMTAVLSELHWNRIGITLEWFQNASKCYWNDRGAIGIALEWYWICIEMVSKCINMLLA